MSFPDVRIEEAGKYAEAYFAELQEASASIDPVKLREAAGILVGVYRRGSMLYSCGNGGSAAVANQLVSDHCKIIRSDTDLTPRAYSLSSHIEMMTAVSNDISYNDVFVFQLAALAQPGDALITISSSGDSENIVRVAQWAKDNDLPVIAMTGFSGGRSAELADVNLHVAADNYGVVEDLHQSLMHILAQYIRQLHMDEELIARRRF